MTATERALALALLVQFFFTVAVMARAGRSRASAIRAGEVRGPVALREDNWPDETRKRANNMNNQFETPTLFYALAILALVIGAASLPLVVFAYGYLASRFAHAWVHTGSNRIPSRFGAFLAGVICLVAMGVLLLVHLLVGGAA